MSDTTEHCDWEERLQDRFDGDLDPAAAAALDEHLASCASCGARMAALQAVDAALLKSIAQETLPEAFDRTVLERIDAAAKADRVVARARAEREWQEQMAALSRQWRRIWQSVLLNVLAGASVVMAVSSALLPFVSRSVDATYLLTQHAAALPAVVIPAALAMAVAAFWTVRSLASQGR